MPRDYSTYMFEDPNGAAESIKADIRREYLIHEMRKNHPALNDMDNETIEREMMTHLNSERPDGKGRWSDATDIHSFGNDLGEKMTRRLQSQRQSSESYSDSPRGDEAVSGADYIEEMQARRRTAINRSRGLAE